MTVEKGIFHLKVYWKMVAAIKVDTTEKVMNIMAVMEAKVHINHMKMAVKMEDHINLQDKMMLDL